MRGYYLRTAFTAAMLLDPGRRPIELDKPPPAVTTGALTSNHAALDWFANEYQALLVSVERGCRDQQDEYTWQLAWALAPYMDRRGHWHEWVATHQAALDSARRLADRPGEAYAHCAIGRACYRLGRYEAADEHLQHALHLYRELGDQPGEAEAQLGLTGLHKWRGRHQVALVHAQEALRLFRHVGQEAGEAGTLAAIGWCRERLGEHEAALAHFRQALDLHEAARDGRGAAHCLGVLGYAQQNLGAYQDASESYRAAAEL